MSYEHETWHSFNPRTDGGGRVSAPRRFFVDYGKTAARSAAKFSMTIPLSFLHIINLVTSKVRLPGQFEWPDLTSPFCNFETASEPE